MKTERQASFQLTRRTSDSNTSDKKIPGHLDTIPDSRAAPQHFSTLLLDGVQEMASSQGVAKEKIPGMVGAGNHPLNMMSLKGEGSPEAETAMEIKATRVISPKELNSWPLNHRKRSYGDIQASNSEAVYAGSTQSGPWNGTNSTSSDRGSASKKGKLDYSDLYGYTDRTSSSKDGPRRQDEASSSAVKKKIYDEGCEWTDVSKTPGNAERYFFPVDPFPVMGVNLNDGPVPRSGDFSVNEAPLEERVPNLELALGAEMKAPPKPSLLPFLAPKVEKNIKQNQPSNKAAIKPEDDDASAGLSLSLSFPFPEKDQPKQPVMKTEQVLSERRKFNPSPLFGGFPDK